MKPLESAEYTWNMDEIARADSREQLLERRRKYQHGLLQLFKQIPIAAWMAAVNQMHDLIMARAVSICEREMALTGCGMPPVPYAFVAFGSLGRREATLWSDQDNGLIISDAPGPEKDRYFELFGKRLSELLQYLGYEKCKGNVMCSEPLWRKTVKGWRHQIAMWSDDLGWEPTRYYIMAADMRHVAGEQTLTEGCREAICRALDEKSDLALAVLRNTVRHKATLNVLGQVVTDRFGEHAGDFDVKYGIYIPLVNSIRFWALQQGIRETSSLKRMEKLLLLDSGNVLLESCHSAFLTAMILRSSVPFANKDGVYTSSGYISRDELKKRTVQYELRESLGIVKRTHRALYRQLRFAERRRS